MTSALVTDEAAADILDKAADEIERRGLHKGYFYEPNDAAMEQDRLRFFNDCKVCAIGAIRTTVLGAPNLQVADNWPTQYAYGKAKQALSWMVWERGHTDVPAYNDAPATTQGDVVALFRETAAALREDVIKGTYDA